MPASKAVHGRLRDHAGTAALISGRIYVGAAPAGVAMPYVVVQRISGGSFDDFSGASGVGFASVQVDVYGTTPDSVNAVRTQVRDALLGFRGAMGDDSLAVRFCSLDGDREDASEPDSSSDAWTYRRSLDFYMTFFEAIPA